MHLEHIRRKMASADRARTKAAVSAAAALALPGLGPWKPGAGIVALPATAAARVAAFERAARVALRYGCAGRLPAELILVILRMCNVGDMLSGYDE